MDCSLAQDLIFKRVETRIEDCEALALHAHVLECSDCRESYLVFDECLEALALFESGEAEMDLVPAGFTQSVMTKIEPVHSREKIEKVKESGWIVLKILWGFSAIILGVTLFLLFNPAVLDNLISRYAAFEYVLNGLEQVFVYLQNGVAALSQSIDFSSASSMSVFALLFVVVMSILLFLLHNNAAQSAPPQERVES